MGGGGALGDHQSLGNLTVGEPLADQRRHLALSERQLVRSLTGPWQGGGADRGGVELAWGQRIRTGLVQPRVVPRRPGGRRDVLAEGLPGSHQPALIPSALAVLNGDASPLSQASCRAREMQGSGW